jgi:hypothetical protein
VSHIGERGRNREYVERGYKRINKVQQVQQTKG